MERIFHLTNATVTGADGKTPYTPVLTGWERMRGDSKKISGWCVYGISQIAEDYDVNFAPFKISYGDKLLKFRDVFGIDNPMTNQAGFMIGKLVHCTGSGVWTEFQVIAGDGVSNDSPFDKNWLCVVTPNAGSVTVNQGDQIHFYLEY